MLGLHRFAWAFSSFGEWGASLCCGAQASHGGCFPCCRAQALDAGSGSSGSGALEHQLSSPGAWAYSPACGILPGHGSNLPSPAMAEDSYPLRHQGRPARANSYRLSRHAFSSPFPPHTNSLYLFIGDLAGGQVSLKAKVLLLKRKFEIHCQGRFLSWAELRSTLWIRAGDTK